MGNTRVLAVCQDRALLREIQQVLKRECFDVRGMTKGDLALKSMKADAPAAVIIGDSPRLKGTELCRRIRSEVETAALSIILITSAGSEDRSKALEAGADVTLGSPVGFRELISRLKALLRRSIQPAPIPEVIQVGDLEVDTGRFEVRFKGRATTALTVLQFKILRFMASRAGHALKREEIIQGALGRTHDSLIRKVDFHLVRVRRKLGPAAYFIKTMRGVGYKLDEATEDPVHPSEG